MAQNTPVTRTLALAAQMLGGAAPLAARLQASVADVERWIEGNPPPPENRIFMLALDIVVAGNAR